MKKTAVCTERGCTFEATDRIMGKTMAYEHASRFEHVVKWRSDHVDGGRWRYVWVVESGNGRSFREDYAPPATEEG